MIIHTGKVILLHGGIESKYVYDVLEFSSSCAVVKFCAERSAESP